MMHLTFQTTIRLIKKNLCKCMRYKSCLKYDKKITTKLIIII